METERRTPPETPLFFNELGVNSIQIGVAAFHCMGVMPPHDHPHVYLNMGDETDILCPYCSTEYRFNAALSRNQTIPASCWAAATKQPRPVPQVQ
jgi:uncharacterized Zn-finger protein